MLQQLPGDGRHAAGGIHLLPLDDFHRPHGIELAHVDHRVPGGHRAHQPGRKGGGVEQRDHRQRHFLAGFRQGIAAAQDGAGHGVTGRKDVRHEVAVRAERSLGLPRRAAGIKDGRLIIRIERHGRQLTGGQPRPIVRRADHVLQPLRPLQRRAGATHQDTREASQIWTQRRNPFPSLVIGDQHLCAGVRQAIGKLLPRPPGVERNRDRAKHRYGEEADDPLGQVAHGDRHPITLPHAVGKEIGRERRNGAELCVVADPLILIDGGQLIPVRARKRHQRGHVRGRILPHARRHAADRHRFHLEPGAGRRQHGFRFLHGHGRPSCGQRLRCHVGFSQR